MGRNVPRNPEITSSNDNGRSLDLNVSSIAERPFWFVKWMDPMQDTSLMRIFEMILADIDRPYYVGTSAFPDIGKEAFHEHFGKDCQYLSQGVARLKQIYLL